MEIALDASMPTYSGGLGVLAGDTLRAAADLALPVVAITLVHRKGYFRQHLDANGRQTESPSDWSPAGRLEAVEARAWVNVEGRPVELRGWRFQVRGVTGHEVPVYLLDTSLPSNDEYDQTLTDSLYGGDARYRLCQEVVLGIGGIAMLRALGHADFHTYHMNEGHSSLLTLALLQEHASLHDRGSVIEADVDDVRRKCVFTTHTPVDAGHDHFDADLVEKVLGKERTGILARLTQARSGIFDLTHLAMFFCRSANGVSIRHAHVSRRMFPERPISAITNGVHAVTWTAAPFARLYDRHVPHWRRDNRYLRQASAIPREDIRAAHAEAKANLLEDVQRRTGHTLKPDVMTIGFARRATGYKRIDFIFSNKDRLRRIIDRCGPIQLVYAGKAHARDSVGKAGIEHIFAVSAALKGVLPVFYLEDYDMSLASLIVAGVDLWLNNPVKPLEASGTSGMKAALNGVPSLSILDGWWIEGWIEGVTGWAIGDGAEEPGDSTKELDSLYDKLEHIILPMFYQQPRAYLGVMRSAISHNGSFFNAQRMVSQYLRTVYEPGMALPEAEVLQ
ncbi:MAG: alpha-glucan family phosphorylase [Chloroflexi bacterium]|nr:MAG: alpha-glucan family phosphorylase [Chloroflexota bacterium]